MGQKSSPIGLRLGLHRKWASSWNFSSYSSYDKLSPIVLPRGGDIRSGIEETIYSLISRQSATLNSISKDQLPSSATNFRLFPIDLRINVAAAGSLFILIFYSKLSTKN